MDKIESYKLWAEFGRNVSSYFMVIAGAQATLIGSVFKECEDKTFALIAILCMLSASILAYSYSEESLRKATEKPNLKNKFLSKIYNMLPDSDDSMLIKEFLSALCFVTSIILFLLFISFSK
jgi:hypothetical membrane protein